MPMRFPLLLSVFLLSMSLFAQVRIRDVYAAAPDSIFPLLTRNNRLDQIDFCENGMQGVVKDGLGQRSELQQLTDSYLKLQLSAHCVVEMRMVSDSTFCMVRTFLGPAADSRVMMYSTSWQPLLVHVRRPDISSFLSDDIDVDILRSFEALPFVRANLSPDNDNITWQLQTTELTREQKEKVKGRLSDVSQPLKSEGM